LVDARSHVDVTPTPLDGAYCNALLLAYWSFCQKLNRVSLVQFSYVVRYVSLPVVNVLYLAESCGRRGGCGCDGGGVARMAAQGTPNYVYFVDQQLGLGASGNVYLGRHKVRHRCHMWLSQGNRNDLN